MSDAETSKYTRYWRSIPVEEWQYELLMQLVPLGDEQRLWDDVAKGEFKTLCFGGTANADRAAQQAFRMADIFIAERRKHLEGKKDER